VFNLEEYLKRRRSRIDEAIDARMPPAELRPTVLHQAMRYAVLSGGKRLRPILCLAASEAAGGGWEEALNAAVAVELVHAYTLIHDDLPCMDDDALRRGKPTCHVAFGEANAVLAGDALQALAFELASQCNPGSLYPPNQPVIELAQAAGSRGVVGGQVEDIVFSEKVPDADAVAFIHLHKTADLFRAAVRMGAVCANAAPEVLDALTTYAVELGLAFQIVDDLLDADSGESDPMSCLAVYDTPRAREESRNRTVNAVAAIDSLDKEAAAPLVTLAERIMERKS